MTPQEIINEIREWANAPHAYLCNREGYPRGYKNGISQAKSIVLEILSKLDVEGAEVGINEQEDKTTKSRT